jgi:hypothetical protein
VRADDGRMLDRKIAVAFGDLLWRRGRATEA